MTGMRPLFHFNAVSGFFDWSAGVSPAIHWAGETPALLNIEYP